MSTSPKFITPEGRRIAENILKGQKLIPHDDQLTCVCRLLDGEHVVGVLPTNAGKSVIFIMYMICVLAIKANPQLHPATARQIPSNAAMIVVIIPTVGLAEEMVCSI